MEEDNSKFTWGDSIFIVKSAPNKFHPGRFASVCGLYKVQSKETVKELECKTGDWVYTVEFGDGSDAQVPERYLDKDLSIVPGKEITKLNKYFVNGVVGQISIGINYIEIEIKSSLINQFIPDNNLSLSNGFFIGKIIATQIENIVIDNSSLSMERQQNGTILAFKISDHDLKLLIKWDRKKTSALEIRSGKIWWEQESLQT